MFVQTKKPFSYEFLPKKLINFGIFVILKTMLFYKYLAPIPLKFEAQSGSIFVIWIRNTD